MLSLSCISNLVRAYDKNHLSLMNLVGSEEFDANDFNALIGRRETIVEEILRSALPESHLRTIHEKHQELEQIFVDARDQLQCQLKQMDTGKKALRAYR